MLRSHSWIPALLAIVAVACAGGGDGLPPELELEEPGKHDDVGRPFGTFERELGPNEFGFRLLALKSDRTYHYEQRLVTCPSGACIDALSGTYRFGFSHGKRYVILYNEGDWWYSFEYLLAGDELRLRHIGGDAWFALTRSEHAWCETVSDCALQPPGTGAACVTSDHVCDAGACQPMCDLDVDLEECRALEGAIDDCVGLTAASLAECIAELEQFDPGSTAKLEACCDADDLWFFCPLP